jgi:hypothetical protein
MASTGQTTAGSGWAGMTAEQYMALLQAQAAKAGAMGYWEQPEYQPTEEEVLMAIYNNRPDLKNAFKNKGKELTDNAKILSKMRTWAQSGEAANLMKTHGSLVGYAQKQTDLAGRPWIAATKSKTETPTMAREQWNAQTGQWEKTFAREGEQWNQNFGLQKDQLGLQQQNAGLSLIQTLAAQRGPADWAAYWQTQNAAANTQLPAWAQILAQKTGVVAQSPAAQGLMGAATGQSIPGTTFGTQQQRPQGSELFQPGAVAKAAPSWAPQVPTQPLGVAPQQVNALQWNALSPTAQQGLVGYVDTMGGVSGTDWISKLQRMMPTGQASSMTAYR